MWCMSAKLVEQLVLDSHTRFLVECILAGKKNVSMVNLLDRRRIVYLLELATR